VVEFEQFLEAPAHPPSDLNGRFLYFGA